MIMLTRFPNGDRIAFNPDLIERAEQNPDTVITLSDGTRYVVSETVEQIIDIVQHYRARVLALAHHLAVDPARSRQADAVARIYRKQNVLSERPSARFAVKRRRASRLVAVDSVRIAPHYE